MNYIDFEVMSLELRNPNNFYFTVTAVFIRCKNVDYSYRAKQTAMTPKKGNEKGTILITHLSSKWSQ